MYCQAEPGTVMVRLAAVCWALWKTRNNLCFEKKMIKSKKKRSLIRGVPHHFNIIQVVGMLWYGDNHPQKKSLHGYFFSLILSGAGLQKDSDRETLRAGADKLWRTRRCFSTQVWHCSNEQQHCSATLKTDADTPLPSRASHAHGVFWVFVLPDFFSMSGNILC